MTADPYNLSRFTKTQQKTYPRALAELQNGRKRSHWMWFIFPQLDGLGHSSTAKFYAIKSREEAQAFLEHPVLGARLQECTQAVLTNRDRSIPEIFGFPDNLKFKSCMTLFAAVAGPDSVFEQALDLCLDGQRDARTLELLNQS